MFLKAGVITFGLSKKHQVTSITGIGIGYLFETCGNASSSKRQS
jgi:hypothetical protein